ncbi:sodium- and chloride-dependent glycine transporter 1-like [Amphiura filiformis]|uniref:sodium- and chloride-dependent glycine transporter 1-like n=1 Tax=Amphiura filiformis TaxID=82378 RepID=UPI003B20B61C
MGFIVPINFCLQTILVFSFVDYTAASMGDYIYPPRAEAIGWTMTMTSVVAVMIYAVVYVCRQEGTLLVRLKTSVSPAPDWGPALNENRILAGYSKLPNGDMEDSEFIPSTKSEMNDKQFATYIALATKDQNESVRNMEGESV